MKIFRILALTLVILSLSALVLSGCGKDKAKEEAAAVPAATTESAQEAPAAMPASNAFLSGKILETMNSGGYSYVLLDTDKGQIWAAGPEVSGLQVGQMVTCPDGMEMRGFQAKSLERTFDSIMFVNTISQEGAGSGMSAMGGMSGMGSSMDKPISGTSTVVEKAAVQGVAKLEGGHTVADIYSQAASLAGKSVKLRGKVVKFTPNIMGTNWVHIQDGTGDANTSDLTVTTSATASVDDVVVVTGALSVDKDFGAGYKYHVIIDPGRPGPVGAPDHPGLLFLNGSFVFETDRPGDFPAGESLLSPDFNPSAGGPPCSKK